MPSFRKKPVVIEAVRWTGGNRQEIRDFVPDAGYVFAGGGLSIHTLEGVLHATVGDWIIKGVRGEFYPCKPDVFEATYESAEAL